MGLLRYHAVYSLMTSHNPGSDFSPGPVRAGDGDGERGTDAGEHADRGAQGDSREGPGQVRPGQRPGESFSQQPEGIEHQGLQRDPPNGPGGSDNWSRLTNSR